MTESKAYALNATIKESSVGNGTYQNGVVTWTVNVAAGQTATVTFEVTVDKNIGAQVITNKAVIVEGNATYTTNEVSNYTVVDEVGKSVYLESKPETSIDGKKVYGGDVLVYQISYKNTANESAAITITDKIPAYTIYVEGSADNGGTDSDSLSMRDGKIAFGLHAMSDGVAKIKFHA